MKTKRTTMKYRSKATAADKTSLSGSWLKRLVSSLSRRGTLQAVNAARRFPS